ncbi:MAG: CHAT domain-containing protein [Erysipelotrichaceae bacterium]|nr:CHAT domain-containing protein [Erysipelotrichaceae bacterium]
MFDIKILDNIIVCLKDFDVHHIDEAELSKQLHCFNELIKNNHIQNIDDQIAFIINNLSSMSSLCEKYKQYTTAILMYQSLETYYHSINDINNDIFYSNKLSTIYINLCDFKNALKYGEIAYHNSIQTLDEGHPTTLYSLNNLALIYRQLGDYQKAIDYGKIAYENNLKVYGDKHPNILLPLNNLASFYMDLGDYQNVLKYSKKSYLISLQILGEMNSYTLTALNLLALCHKYLGDFETALKYGQKVYQNSIQILGEIHPDTLSYLHNLASYYRDLKDYSNALKYQEEVYYKRKDILGDDNLYTLVSLNGLAAVYQELGDEESAIYYEAKVYEKYKKLYGEDHPDTIALLNNLASMYLDNNDYDHGLIYAKEAYIKNKEILGDHHPRTLTSLYNLGACYSGLNKPEKQYDCSKTYLINFINLLNNVSLINDKNALRHYLDTLQTVYKSFGKSIYTYAINLSEDIDLLLKYKNIIFDIEFIKRNNEKINANLYNNVSLNNIQSVLKKEHAIMDFYDYDNRLDLLLITKYKCQLYTSVEFGTMILSDLFKGLDIEHIYICPDGDLYNISFDELLSGYDISYLSSAKSLLWQNDDVSNNSSVSIVCPDFDIHQKVFVDDNDDYTKGNVMNHLYGGFIEEKYLKKKVINLHAYERQEANYDNFLSIKSPRILHISTHGGYKDDIITDNPTEKGILYLSGYNDKQKGYSIDNRYNKGYVSANEIQFMDLRGTDLVVLSACSTAVGTSLPGEGVYGLRRAFELAGAKTILMTQREVDDFNTAIFIKIYFEKYHGDNPYKALKETKRYLLDYDDLGIQNGIVELELLKEDFMDVFSQKNHQMNNISLKP